MAGKEKTATTVEPGRREVTVQGIRLTVDPKFLDDMKVLQWLYDIQSAQDGDPSGALSIAPLFRTVCGSAYTKVMDRLAEEDGRVPVEKASNFIVELIGKANPNS